MIERESLIISKLILGLSPARLLLFVPGKRWTVEKMLIGSIFIDSNWASNKSLRHSFHWKSSNLNLQRQRCDINVKLSISTHLSTIDSNTRYFLKMSFSSTPPPHAVELLPISDNDNLQPWSVFICRLIPWHFLFLALFIHQYFSWMAAQGVKLHRQKPIKCTQPPQSEIISMRVIKLWNIIMSCGSSWLDTLDSKPNWIHNLGPLFSYLATRKL